MVNVKSFFNNQIVAKLLAPAAFKVGSKVWVRYLGVIEGHPEGFAIRDGSGGQEEPFSRLALAVHCDESSLYYLTEEGL